MVSGRGPGASCQGPGILPGRIRTSENKTLEPLNSEIIN